MRTDTDQISSLTSSSCSAACLFAAQSYSLFMELPVIISQLPVIYSKQRILVFAYAVCGNVKMMLVFPRRLVVY